MWGSRRRKVSGKETSCFRTLYRKRPERLNAGRAPAQGHTVEIMSLKHGQWTSLGLVLKANGHGIRPSTSRFIHTSPWAGLERLCSCWRHCSHLSLHTWRGSCSPNRPISGLTSNPGRPEVTGGQPCPTPSDPERQHTQQARARAGPVPT